MRNRGSYHSITFVFDSVDEAAELFKRSCNNDFVIGLTVADTFKLEAHQTRRQIALRPRQSYFSTTIQDVIIKIKINQ